MKVVVVPSKKTGALVTAYANKPSFGFIQLSSETIEVGNGWLRRKKRSALVRAEVADLNVFISSLRKSDGSVPGFITVQEYTESAVPESWLKRLNQTLAYEERIAPFVKKASTGGIELLVAGERILRFTDYLMAGEPSDFDCFVQHDNGETIKTAMKAAKEGEGADLDGTDTEDGVTADTDADVEAAQG